jgi:hypothetical protein
MLPPSQSSALSPRLSNKKRLHGGGFIPCSLAEEETRLVGRDFDLPSQRQRPVLFIYVFLTISTV